MHTKFPSAFFALNMLYLVNDVLCKWSNATLVQTPGSPLDCFCSSLQYVQQSTLMEEMSFKEVEFEMQDNLAFIRNRLNALLYKSTLDYRWT